MEDTAILRSLLHWLFPGGRITAKIVTSWLFVIALFTCYGFNDSAMVGAILMGGFGIGVATCIVGGLMILANVQANRITKLAAFFHLITSSIVSTLATPATIVLLGPCFPKASDMLRGEGFLGIALVSLWTGIVALISFVLLTIAVILSRQQPADGGAQVQKQC